MSWVLLLPLNQPIGIFEIFEQAECSNLKTKNERAHFISIAFQCYIPRDYVIDNHGLNQNEAGYLKWFDSVPNKLLRVKHCYRERLGKIMC